MVKRVEGCEKAGIMVDDEVFPSFLPQTLMIQTTKSRSSRSALSDRRALPFPIFVLSLYWISGHDTIPWMQEINTIQLTGPIVLEAGSEMLTSMARRTSYPPGP